MKCLLKFYCLIIFLLKFASANCQSISSVSMITNCLLFSDLTGNPTFGLNLRDSNATLIIATNWGINQYDTTTISFDQYGRIDYMKSMFEETRLKYLNDTIKIKSISFYPSVFGLCTHDTIQYEFHLMNNLISQIIIECKEWKKVIQLKYIQIPSGILVELYDRESLLERNVFLFDVTAGYFQWEIVSNNNINFKFKIDRFEIISQFEVDSKYRLVSIENITFKNSKLKIVEGIYPDKYSLFNAAGEVFGSILVNRIDH